MGFWQQARILNLRVIEKSAKCALLSMFCIQAVAANTNKAVAKPISSGAFIESSPLNVQKLKTKDIDPLENERIAELETLEPKTKHPDAVRKNVLADKNAKKSTVSTKPVSAFKETKILVKSKPYSIKPAKKTVKKLSESEVKKKGEFKADNITKLTNESLAKYQKKYENAGYFNDVYIESGRFNESYASQPKKANRAGLTAHPLPVGKRTSGFGYRRLGRRRQFHKGLDFAARIGTPIYAAGSGVVTISGWLRGYGRVVYIDHGNGFQTRYAHASRLLVKKGQRVQAGQLIAKVGNSGRSTGPHLHFEVRKNGRAQNPARYLP